MGTLDMHRAVFSHSTEPPEQVVSKDRREREMLRLGIPPLLREEWGAQRVETRQYGQAYVQSEARFVAYIRCTRRKMPSGGHATLAAPCFKAPNIHSVVWWLKTRSPITRGTTNPSCLFARTTAA